MSWSEDQDKALQTCLKTFGVPVKYGRNAVFYEITGIFDHNHFEVDVNSGVPISTVSPVLGVRVADLPDGKAEKSDRVEVNGTLYRLVDFKPDSCGGAKLFLQEV